MEMYDYDNYYKYAKMPTHNQRLKERRVALKKYNKNHVLPTSNFYT